MVYTRAMDPRARMLRLGIIATLFSLVALLFVQLVTKSLSIPALPSRLIVFVIAAGSSAICSFIWMMWRIRRKRPQTNEVVHGQRAIYPWRGLAQTLGLLAIFEACACGIISIAFGISLKKMWEPYLLFFSPALVGLPLVLRARQFIDRPKLYAFWLALGLSAFSSLVVIASFYSGFMSWIFPGATDTGGFVFALIFIVIVASATAFYLAKLRVSKTGSA